MTTWRNALAHEMGEAREHLANRRFDQTFGCLKRAHVLGQLRLADHVVVHLLMLRIAIVRGDGREMRGQVLRLFATVPGHLFGWLPIGNTGGADVSPLKPMSIPADLAPHFAGFSLRRQILRQWAVIAAIAVGGITLLMARSS